MRTIIVLSCFVIGFLFKNLYINFILNQTN